MRKILIIAIFLTQVLAQSVNASLTIYKDGIGLVKQPVSWNISGGNNIIQYDRLTDGMFTDSPFLNIEDAVVRSQRLNRNVFSSGNYFQNKLGEEIELKLSDEKTISGTLLEYGHSQITIKNKSNIRSYYKDNLDFISVKHDEKELNLRPVLSWDIYSQKPGTVKGNLVYLSSGFDWNTNYRFIMLIV
jgi:hypothetical protein